MVSEHVQFAMIVTIFSTPTLLKILHWVNFTIVNNPIAYSASSSGGYSVTKSTHPQEIKEELLLSFYNF